MMKMSDIDVRFYSTSSVFEFTPAISLNKCVSLDKSKVAYSLMFSWFTFVLEFSWVTF